jgi:LmbE family N-acetylglucosaminyl deacetylase
VSEGADDRSGVVEKSTKATIEEEPRGKMMAQPLSILLTVGVALDAVERAGGTLAIHAERGDRVAVAILRPVAAMTPDHGGTAKSTVEAGLRILGVEEIYFLDVDDADLVLSKDLILRIADVIRRVRPDVIITHHPWEGMGYATDAGGVASLCTNQAIGVASSVDPTSEFPPIDPPSQVFWFTVLPKYRWTAMNDIYYDVYVDISQVAQRKVQALRQLHSGDSRPYADKYVEAVDGVSGLVSHTGYAEGFMRTYLEVCDSLPIAGLKRERTREEESEMWVRMSKFDAHKAP